MSKKEGKVQVYNEVHNELKKLTGPNTVLRRSYEIVERLLLPLIASSAYLITIYEVLRGKVTK